jgi:hypothetical protein
VVETLRGIGKQGTVLCDTGFMYEKNMIMEQHHNNEAKAVDPGIGQIQPRVHDTQDEHGEN